MTMASGFVRTILLAFGRETYSPIMLQRKVNRLRKAAGNSKLHHRLDNGSTPIGKIKRGIVRPLKLLFFSLIGFISAIYLAMA